MVKVAGSGAKGRLQFTPQFMQLVAMRVRGAQRLPTVQSIERRTRTERTDDENDFDASAHDFTAAGGGNERGGAG
jgi:hypothetical protein